MSSTRPLSGTRSGRLWLGAALSLLGAGATGIALIAVSQTGVDNPEAGQARRDAAATGALLRGVPQHGVVLGDAHSRVRVIEFIDLRCRRCWAVAHRLLPTLVRSYLRPARIRLELWPLGFRDPQSMRAARAALAAAGQNRLWSFLAALNQSHVAEARGDLSDAYLRQIGRAVPGLDVERMLRDVRHSRGVADQLLQAHLMARHMGVDATPALLVDTAHDGIPEKLELRDPKDPRATRAIDSALRRGVVPGRPAPERSRGNE